MENSSLETLLLNANQAVTEGNWSDALNYLLQAREIQPYNADLLTAIGGVHIQMGKADEALEYYQEALRLQPYSAQAHQNLANAYAIMGQYSEAESSYRRALELDEDDRFSWLGLARVCIVQEKYQEGVEILAALVKSDPQDFQAVTLLAECYEQAGDSATARWLYQQALDVEQEYSPAKQGLQRIQSQEGFLGEIDKQALSQKLAALKSKLQAQQKQTFHTQATSPKSILFCGPPLASSELRFGSLAQELMRRGFTVQITTRFEGGFKSDAQLLLISRPHVSQDLTEAVLQSKEKGVKVIVDLDEDFFSLPAEYSNASTLSATHPEVAKRLNQVLQAADLVTVPSERLVEVYGDKTKRVVFLPYGWDATNPMWTKPTPPRKAIKIGFLANHIHPEDLKVLGDSLQHLCDQNPQVLVGVVAGIEVYEALQTIDDERKFLVPPGRIEDYPYLLADFDLLLFPLSDIPYNRSKSDLALLECGARKVCWIASPIAAYRSWEKGGLFATNPAEWEEALKTLLGSPSQRALLAEEGYQKALSRTIAQLSDQWVALFTSL
ncbi:MAG: TPR repeat [Anaerolineae bacterium]|nr:MAG: TPR repeat [Anaerolineae bacterium]